MSTQRHDEVEEYEAPVLSDYGTVEAWTKGTMAQGIVVSIII